MFRRLPGVDDGTDGAAGGPVTLRSLGNEWVGAVERLAEDAEGVDGVAPLNEQARLHLRDATDPDSRHLMTTEQDELVGYAYLDLSGDPATNAECVVAPQARNRGIGGKLVQTLLAASRPRPLTIWSHGDHPAAAAVGRRNGLRRARELRRMRRPLDLELPPADLPAGIELRTFRPGADDAEWVALNARAFAGHPEQGGMTVEDLHRRQQQPWFEPDGFFVATRNETLVGFHWTKVDGDIGEVYVVGVSPDAQGSGLGRALTLRGLHHLRERGLPCVELYVEADNDPALTIYGRLGFDVVGVDVMYASQ